jgi:DNA gyrase subunit A
MEYFELSDIQAKAILELRLQRLTGLERDKIAQEYAEIMKLIDELNQLLSSEEQRMALIKKELTEIKDRYGDERRTRIELNADDITDEDMIPDEEMVITISHQGYIKRTASVEFKAQGRGGVGSKGASSKDDDFTEHLFIATNHNYLLIFTDFGRLYWLKVYELPEMAKNAKGRAIQNIINIERDDKIRAVINVKNLGNPDYVNNNYIVMCTKNGTIKKTLLEAYSRPRANGIIAINIVDGDRLLDVHLTNGSNEIIMALRSGRAIRFNESKVRAMGRNATGVRGVSLANENDQVVGMVCVADPNTNLLVVSEKGYGKRSEIEEYRITNRGGKGVKTMNVTDKTGHLVSILEVSDEHDLMIINKSGITIRTAVAQIRVMGRNTQGVKLIRLSEGDEISSIARIESEPEIEIDENPSTETDQNVTE